MRTIRMWSRRQSRGKRRGVSTVLGTMIFIGVMFTTVIPMFLVMKQADTMYERKMLELDRLDEETERERIELYAFPRSFDEPQWINVTAYNKCEFSVNLVNLWINEVSIPLSVTIPSMGSINVASYEINAQDGSSYDVKATSDRGNVYVSETGTLTYSEGEWESETLGINLIFPSRPGQGGKRGNDWKNELKITITENAVGGDSIYEDVVMYWAISASEKFLELGAPGTYNVTVWIKQANSDPYNGVVYGPIREPYAGSAPITIDWPDGPAVLDVNFLIVNDPDDAHLEIDE